MKTSAPASAAFAILLSIASLPAVPAGKGEPDHYAFNMPYRAEWAGWGLPAKYARNGSADSAGVPFMQEDGKKNPVASAMRKKSDQQAAEMIKSAQSWASFAQAYAEADDKPEFLKQRGLGYANSKADQFVRRHAGRYGVNAEIVFGIRDLDRIEPSGKVLFPLYNRPQGIAFVQTGLAKVQEDRAVAHLGFGFRGYPEAVSRRQAGSWMYGFNAVWDLDATRGHQRLSIGGEFATERFSLSGNVYSRLTGWRNSRDFSGGYVQERPANGFDLNGKVFLPQRAGLGKAAVAGTVAHWEGRDASPFGNPSTREDSPWIYSLGLEWQPVPAFTASLKHSITDGGHSDTHAKLAFNIPLGAYDFPHAFDPDALNYGSGLSLAETRMKFIERDYSMPLQYRATPGRYHIAYIGPDGRRSHVFSITDGLDRGAAGTAVSVSASDKCVKLSQDGNYSTDGSGRFAATVLLSCTPSTTLTVKAGSDAKSVRVQISTPDLKLSVQPKLIARYSTSLAMVEAPEGSEGVAVKWSLSGAGALSGAQAEIASSNTAQALFTPDQDASADYAATITAVVNGVKLSAPVTVKAYGAGAGSALQTDGSTEEVEGNQIIRISYPGLEPGTTVKWAASGNGALSADAGASSTSAQLETTVSDDGTAMIYAKAADVDNGSLEVTAQTPDGHLAKASYRLRVRSYAAKVASPSSTDPGDKFTLSLSGLKAGTSVSWGSAEGAIPESENSAVDASGNASMAYTASSSAFSGKIRGIKARYYRNVGATSEAEFSDIAISEYSPALSAFPEDFSGSDSFTITLSGTKPGFPVTWAVSGNAVLSEQQETADEEGNATAVITGIAPYTGAVSVTASAMGKEITAQGVLHSWNPVLSAPDTSDYKQEIPLSFTGLKPGSKIKLSSASGSVTFKEAEITAGADGTVQAVVNAITDFTLNEFEISAECAKNSAETVVLTHDVSLSAHQLSITASKTSLDAYAGNSSTPDSMTITVSGGLPGEEAVFSVDGDAELSAEKAKFGEDGTASVTLSSKEPFKTSPKASVTAMSRAASLEIPYSTTTYAPQFELPSFTSIYGNTTNLDYDGGEWSYKITGLLPGSTTTMSRLPGMAGTLEAVADASGTAEFKALPAQTAGGTIIVEYVESGVQRTTASIGYTVASYPLTASSSAEAIDAYAGSSATPGSATLTLSGGKPGAAIQWSSSGDCTLSNASATFDAQGSAAATVNARSPFAEAPSVTASSLNRSASTSFTYSLTTYSPAAVMPTFTSIYGRTTNLDYAKPWSMKVSGALPGSKVTVSSDDAGSETEAADSTGTATFTKLKAQKKAGSVKIRYLKSGVTYAETSASYTVASYPLSIKASKATLDAYGGSISEPDSITMTISGGQPGATVGWGVTGDATLSSTTVKFDKDGNATATLNSKSGYAKSPEVSGTSLGEDASTTVPYSLTTYAPKFSLPSFTSIYSRTTTLDYQGGAWGFTVSGLLPGSTASITGPASQSVTVASNGVATFSNLPQQTAGGTITLTYRKSGVTDATATANYSVASYPLTMTTDKSEIYGNETFTTTVTGGKPGAAVSWSISGSGQYTAKASNFNAQGVATASVQGIDPYSGTITAGGSSMGGTAQTAVSIHSSWIWTIGTFNFHKKCGSSDEEALIFTAAAPAPPSSGYRRVRLDVANFYIDDIFALRMNGADLAYIANGAEGNAASGYPPRDGSNVWTGSIPARAAITGHARNQHGFSGCEAHLAFSGTVMLIYEWGQ